MPSVVTDEARLRRDESEQKGIQALHPKNVHQHQCRETDDKQQLNRCDAR
jgi:hypothetical protein